MRPLDGVQVVVTRAAHQAEEMSAPLRDLGAEVILVPVIGIAPPADPAPLDQAAKRANEYDWIIFTSANAVSGFVAACPLSPVECKARVATIGSATREAAEQHGFRVTLVPERYVAESLVEAFAATDLHGRRILIPSAAVTRDIVPADLRKRGAEVEVVEAYRNVMPPGSPERAALVFREPYPDWVSFASPSAIDNLIKLIGAGPLRAVKIATIGPVTSEAVRRHGLPVSVEAVDHTAEGMVLAILGYHRAARANSSQ
jgi:uroporphyrinogen III methyltransferase/synthase